MRIARFSIKNYKGIEHLELRMPKTIDERPASGNLLSIIGKNNAGKSSILNALHKALELGRASIEDFPHHKPEEYPICVEIEFDEITELDKTKPAVGPHLTPDGTYVIRIEWSGPGAPTRKVKDAQPQFIHPDNRQKGTWLAHPVWSRVIKSYEEKYGPISSIKNEVISKLEQIAFAQNETSVFKMKEWQDDERYRQNPAGWQSLLLNALPRVVYVPAIRDTREEAEVGKKNTTIRQLVSYMFEKQLDKHRTIHSLKTAALKVSKLFAPEEKDQVVSAMEKSINDILTPLAGVTGHLGYSNKDIAIDLGGYAYYLIKDQHGPETKPEHHGHGTQRALILSLLQALAELETSDKAGKGLLLLFEEPEIYLHPEMCRKMRDTLITISRRKDSQVICTTHSPVFLDLAERHDGILLLKKDPSNGMVTCFQRTQDIFNDQDDKESRQRLRMILNFDPAVNELFFSERVCLVEGDTEMAAIGAVAEKLVETGKIDREKYQRARHEMTMISCRGKATIPAFQKVLNEFGIKYRVVHDSDSDKKNNAALQTLNAQIASLMKQAYPTDAHLHTLVHDPNFEYQNLQQTFLNDKPWRTATNIHERETLDGAVELLKYFEFALHSPIDKLTPEPLPTDNDTSSLKRNFDAPRRNTRHNYQPYREVLLREARRLASHVVIGIAAGPGHIDDLEEFCTSDHLGKDLFVAKVKGDSMLDTLQSNDLVLLRTLNVCLEPVADKASMTNIERFRENIVNNRIYVVAINDGIERNEYTIKRVLFSGSGVDWICRIVADNPEVEWHSRGEFVVRRTDRIHFAAELVALVKDIERPVAAEEVSAPVSPAQTA